jgi:hypothetical protein
VKATNKDLLPRLNMGNKRQVVTILKNEF